MPKKISIEIPPLPQNEIADSAQWPDFFIKEMGGDCERLKPDFVYMNNIKQGEPLILKRFIGINTYTSPNNNKFYCLDYFDDDLEKMLEDGYGFKRIAFQCNSTIGSRFKSIINEIKDFECRQNNDAKSDEDEEDAEEDFPSDEDEEDAKEAFIKMVDKFKYSSLKIKRCNKLFFIYLPEGEPLPLIGDCSTTADLSIEEVKIKQILYNQNLLPDLNQTHIHWDGANGLYHIKYKGETRFLIGAGNDNEISKEEKEVIWFHYQQNEFSNNQEGEDKQDENKVFEYLESLFQRPVQKIRNIIKELGINRDTDPSGSTDLHHYVKSVEIPDPEFSTSFLCVAHIFEKDNNGACLSYSYEESKWSHINIEQDNFNKLSTLKLPDDKSVKYNVLINLPEEIHEYVKATTINIEENAHVWFQPIGKKRDSTFSAFFLVVSKNKEIIDCFKANSDRLYDYLFFLQRVNQIEKDKQITKKSIKSAISAIMSRNMSHNLGSHYLYYTKSHLEKLANDSKNSGPDIRGAAKVLGYMQARMDYLATIISNDKYPNGAVNFKSQIYDELTIDDFSKRHFSSNIDKTKRTINFLLSNIILSENFSRSNIYSNDVIPEDNHMPLILQVKMWNGNSYDTFTGSSKKPIAEKEENVKKALAKLNVALPGGTMSCHAFFNVLENFIRNSAKYLQEDFNKGEGLVITIAIKPNEEDEHKYDFIIYDNKSNANIPRVYPDGSKKTLVENINGQLESLRILDDFNGVEKSSKGLKEMLFSSVWMRTYNYPEESYTDIISKIHNERDNQKKLVLINHYAFSIVPVDFSGEITDENDTNANLGLVFTLPEFQYLAKLAINSTDSETSIIKKSLQTYADIVEFDRDFPAVSETDRCPYLHYFTRMFFSKSFDELGYKHFVAASNICEDNNLSRVAYKYKTILDRKFWNETGGDIDKVQISIGGDIFDGKDLQDDKYTVYFQRHLNSQKDLTDFIGYAYADSISGGNYTMTLSSLMQQGLDDFGNYKTWADRIYGLKVKEFALTRITIIDERLYTSMHSAGSVRELELSLKNIRVLNYEPDNDLKGEFNFNAVLKGNSFRDSKPGTHFLSIHLGLIEKMIKSEQIVKCISSDNIDFDKRVELFMEKLIRDFSIEDRELFVSIHSGRGNFSKELEGALANYPFISLSAIENAYNNSKFLLSQLFYNTIFIGKGNINKKEK